MKYADGLWERVVTELVGVPFLWEGRDISAGGLDCWGLVLEATRRLGLPVPPDYHPDSPADSPKEFERGLSHRTWVRQEQPAPGDVAMLSYRKEFHHAGLVTPFGILHVPKDMAAMLASEASLKACGYRRIEYYRYIEEEGSCCG